MAMRRLMAAAAVSLVLTGCVIPVPVPHVRINAATGAGVAVVAGVAEVRAGLRRAKEKLAAAPDRFTRSECGRGECVSARDVARALAAVHKELRKSFPKDAAPLLEAVEKQLDVEAATLGPPRRMDGIQPVKSGGSELGYDARTVDGAFSRMAAIVDHFLSINDLALTLNVQTDPKDADFTIQIPANNSTRRSINTDNQMPNVWRGVYTATVSKRGFKQYVTTVDLINDGRTQVTCTLMPRSATADSVCHVR